MRLGRIPSIIGLHYVTDDEKLNSLKPWAITRQSFLLLVDFLQKEGYTTIGFEELLSGTRRVKTVILTFDDCPKHLFDFAIPELHKRGMKAVFYMPTALLGTHNKWNTDIGLPQIELMNEQELRDLVNMGMEVGSHAHNHVMLSECSEIELKHQLTHSKAILERIIGKPVLSIAYPYGDLPCGYDTLVKDAGYHFGLAIVTPVDSVYALRRWEYHDEDTASSIRWKLSPAYLKYRILNDKWTYAVKKLSSEAYKIYAKMKHAIISCTGVSYWMVDETLMVLGEENYLLFL